VLRVLAAVLGLALLAAVVFLGLHVNDGPFYVIWFGLASALVAPVALTALGTAFKRSDQRVLERLSKVPEIERLISEARTQEERIRLLDRERADLVRTIQQEARREALLARRDSLESDGVRVLAELDAIDAELRGSADTSTQSHANAEVTRLYERLRAERHGDVVIRLGAGYFTLNRDLMFALPGGRLVYAYIQLMNSLLDRIRLRRDTDGTKR
jgi:hypothetical protein